MVAYTASDAILRKEYIDTAVKAVALANYKMLTLCQIDSSNSATETYFRETNTELTGGTGSNVRGIPRFAAFPYGEVSETKISSVMQKYGMEGQISADDIATNNVNMIQRTILRIGRAVSYAVDVAIESVLNVSFGNTVAITSGYEWDSATVANRDPVKNILDSIQMIRADNLDALNGNGYLVVNGTDYTNIISNSKILNNPTFKTASDVQNGVVGEICGLKIMVTEVVTADCAYVVIAKEALTWKEVSALTVVQIEDQGIKTTIRAYQRGVAQLTTPNAVCKITNTRA